MDKYEYKIVRERQEFDLEEWLNNKGEEGWELVQVLDTNKGPSFILKRKKTDLVEESWVHLCIDGKNHPTAGSVEKCPYCGTEKAR